MLALDSLRDQISAEPAQEAALPQVEEAASAPLSAEGAVPAVGDGGALEVGATASEQAFGDKPTAQTGDIGGGMYEPAEYQAACTAAGLPEKWDDQYAHGHTEATQWTQPYEGRYDMAFDLKRGNSASQAVKDFVAGPTIADYRAIAVAVELDELRDDLGDQRFDQMFGSADQELDNRISGAQRLKITSAMYTIPFAQQMLALAAENEAVDKTSEPEAPAMAAGVEQTAYQAGITAQPAPEMIAAELGVTRDQELA